MSNPNAERDERVTVQQVRELLAKRKTEMRPLPSTELYIAHVDYLLSLLDSQAADRPDSAGQFMRLQEAARMLIQRFEREYQDLTDGQYGTVETFPEVKTVRKLIGGVANE